MSNAQIVCIIMMCWFVMSWTISVTKDHGTKTTLAFVFLVILSAWGAFS